MINGKKIISLAVSVVLLLSAFTISAEAAEWSETVVDGHLHYLDFLQRSDGFSALTKKMDACGVDSAVIFGMAMAKQWDENTEEAPTYYLSNDSRCYYYSGTDHLLLQALRKQPESVRNRFYPFICGINPNDRYAASQLRALLEMYPGEIYGIGEIMSRHDDLTALTYGEPPHADHPAFLEIFDLAAEYDIPVLIHHNISGVNIEDPIYLKEMQNALAHNRDAKIIWAHVGISRRINVPTLLKIADTMLKENENLYYDISWIVFEDYINKDKASLKDWAKLIEKYPDRFIFGTDKVGHWDTYPQEATKYMPLIEQLSDETADKLLGGNILELIGVQENAAVETMDQAA